MKRGKRERVQRNRSSINKKLHSKNEGCIRGTRSCISGE